MIEEWRTVVGYDGFYEVSNTGQVRSLPIRLKIKQATRLAPGKVLVPYNNGQGQLVLRLSRDGKRTTKTVASIVGAAFLNVTPGVLTDHKNRNTEDNQLTNLRPATFSQNAANSGPRPRNVSGFKGVSWFALRNKWRAAITVDGKQKHLGYFDDPIDGARRYNAEALERFGEYAWLNPLP